MSNLRDPYNHFNRLREKPKVIVINRTSLVDSGDDTEYIIDGGDSLGGTVTLDFDGGAS